MVSSQYKYGDFRIYIEDTEENPTIYYQHIDDETKIYSFSFDNDLTPSIIEISKDKSIDSIIKVNSRIKRDIPDFGNYGEFYRLTIGNDNEELLINHLPITGIRFYDMGMISDSKYESYEVKKSIYLVSKNRGPVLIDKNSHSIEELISPLGLYKINNSGETLYLIPFAYESGVSAGDYFIRIYNEDLHLKFQSAEIAGYFPDGIIDPIIVDLNNDNKDEIILFSSTMSPYNNFSVYSLENSYISKKLIELDPHGKRMHGEDIITLQTELQRKGYDIGPDGIDGWYGHDTYNAVIHYQKDNNIIPTGVVDELTWEKILK